MYNNITLGNRALALALSGIVLNFIFSFLTWLAYPRRSKTEVEESKSDNSAKQEMTSLPSNATEIYN